VGGGAEEGWLFAGVVVDWRATIPDGAGPEDDAADGFDASPHADAAAKSDAAVTVVPFRRTLPG
jgi:hypothetical protein